MKKFKDPIYGYIEIDADISEEIINTPEFQRLRDIIQTSYSSLYTSAVHNRFVHSLGVYHLGKIVAHSINKVEDLTISQEEYIKIFEYACLLHDVGHAPFSHTGEDFYLGADSSRKELHEEIIELTNDIDLKNEILQNNYSATPHELMSVIVGLKKFDFLFKNDKERSFFARCILGYNYTDVSNIDTSYLNCLISLLNSSLIDVDKLDYLMRDSYIIGFDTVSIDYERLLKSIQILKYQDQCKLVFTKSAISIIENVIFAHDAERKWIQNHPVVQYEAYILKYAMEKLKNKYNIFSYDCLTTTGKELTDSFSVSLLNDSDVLFLMKNQMNDKLINEYFARNKRRHPLWKSEAEYKAIFNPILSSNAFEKLENEFNDLGKYLNSLNKLSEINEEALNSVKEDIKISKSLLKNITDNKLKSRLSVQIKQKQKHLKWLECLKKFAKNQKIKFDFLIIKANQFNSGFSKLAFDDIEIHFSDLQCTSKFKDINNTLSSAKSMREKFFYIFYYRTTSKRISVTQLSKDIMNLCVE